MIAAAVVGVGLAAYGAIKSAEDKSDAAEAEAASREAQAQEVEYRAGRNANLIGQEGAQVLGSEGAGFAAGGVELSGSALLTLQGTQAKMNQDIYQTYHEARFRASQLRAGAQVDSNLASDYVTAGWRNAGGTAAMGTANILSKMGGGGGPPVSGMGSPTILDYGSGATEASYRGLV